MPRASTHTLLPLSTWAAGLGIDPLHFSQTVTALKPDAGCSRIYFQYDWQSPSLVSREQIAELIHTAERDIADAVGYWPAPRWESGQDDYGEHHGYPRPRQPEWYGFGLDARGRPKTLKLHRGWFIAAGQRGTEILNDGNEVVWTPLDIDGDTFDETARFQFTVDADLDVCQVKAYFKEYLLADAANSRTNPGSSGADPDWEVRPLSVSLAGTTLTVYVKVWELIRPQLQEELAPDAAGVDGDDFGTGAPDLGSYVDALVFYREYPDTENQVTFLWSSDLSCASAICADDTQIGCLNVSDRRNSLVRPEAAVYNDDDGTFTSTFWTEGVEPDGVLFWYLAGWRAGSQSCFTPMDPFWARIVRMLSVARAQWPLCDCSNVNEISKYWQQDAALMTRDRSFQVRPEELSNPFGTKVGELLAWRQVAARTRKQGRTVNV